MRAVAIYVCPLHDMSINSKCCDRAENTGSMEFATEEVEKQFLETEEK